MIHDPYKDDNDDYNHFVKKPRREECADDAAVKRVVLCSKCNDTTSFVDTGDECIITCQHCGHKMNEPNTLTSMSELRRYRSLKRRIIK